MKAKATPLVKSSTVVVDSDNCPLCATPVIPGMDYCYCRSCKEWYITPMGIRMEEEKERKKETRIANAKGGKGRGKNKVLNELSQLSINVIPQPISHHDFENDY